MALERLFDQTQQNSEGMEALATERFDAPILQNFKLFLLKFSSNNTREAYERAFVTFFDYWQSTGHPVFEAAQVQRSHLDIWNRVLEAQYSPSTVAAKLSAVLSFFQFCKQNDWIASNPGEFIGLPRISRSKGKTEAFSESEIRLILGKLKEGFERATEPYLESSHSRAWVRYVLFLTLCTVGMRVSEVIHLRLGDLETDGEFPRLRMSLKGGEEHAPLIPDELAALLKQYVLRFRNWAQKESPLFVLSPKSNKPLTREYISRMIADIAQECGIQKSVSSHTCRATVASLLHKNAVPVGEIKDLLGHKSILTTMMYVRKTDEEKESAARKNPIFNMMRK
ncbi:MAG: tyrosine-type recombinase/integrase [Bdellovibrionota bacterium]